MSLNYTQIIREIEKNCGFDVGGIANNTQRKADFTADINMAYDEILPDIIRSSGTWKFDDTYHDKYPIIYTDLFNGQRDYTFTVDGEGSLILGIYKVYAKTPQGVFNELTPKDVEGFAGDTIGFTNGQLASGVPDSYDKMANGIFLDPIPNYDSVNGLKVFIDREPLYFTVNDTTKLAGFAGSYHELLVLIPSYKYARNKNLSNRETLKRDIEEMKLSLKAHYSYRTRDEKKRLKPRVENNK
jgi:hypothetical protein